MKSESEGLRNPYSMARPLQRAIAMMTAPRATAKRKSHRRTGLTMIEIMVVVAIIGVLTALAAPQLQQFLANQRVKGAARSAADALLLARTEAIRTGNPHVVFFSPGTPAATDPGGTSLGDDPVTDGTIPVAVLNDGTLAAPNCRIDPGEPIERIAGALGVAWGSALSGGTRAPGDDTTGDPLDGVSFQDPSGNEATWVLFRPDGVPVAFDNACTTGTLGSGNGAVYVTNGRRDYAVVLTALGGVRVHAWEAGAGQWTE